MSITQHHHVASIYNKDSTNKVTINSSTTDGIFIYQNETILMEGNPPLTLDTVYTKVGFYYVGDKKVAEMLLSKGITEQIQPHSGNIEHTCSIGFNPIEQSWNGWSHRAIFGFGIGSEVKKGDCAYHPTCAADMEAEYLAFWDIGIERECETPDKKCTTQLDYMNHDVVEDGVLGFKASKTTTFNFEGRGPFTHVGFEPYPAVWGRGEWRALTLDDAKEMAIAFAAGVS